MSKLILGTVQFGIDYGVSNVMGRTSDTNVRNILNYAYDKGIDILDTAPVYGNSEGIIGDFSNGRQWNIITKTLYSESNVVCEKQVNELVGNFKLSQKKLCKKKIYGLLIHSCDDLFLPGGDKLFKTMEKLKSDGVVEKIGVSLYNGNQIDRILDNYHPDLVQLPINILDQQLLYGGQLKRLKENNVEIHARSVFLQGLLLMRLKDVPVWFNPIRENLEEFHIKAKKLNMNPLQLALGFVQSISEVDKVLVGINNLKQLHEIINATLVNVNINELSDISICDSNYLNPSNWKI